MTEQQPMTARPDNPAAETPPPPKRQRSWWKIGLAGVTGLFVLVLAVLIWLLGTQSGLRFGVHTIPTWFGIRIQTATLNGSVWRGFDGTGWHIRTDAADIDFDKLVFSWNNRELWRGRLHVHRLEVGKIHWTGKRTAPQPPKPVATLPQSVSLPLAINIDAIVVGGFSIGKPEQNILLPSEVSYVYDHEHHQLRIAALRTPWHEISGNLSLSTRSPFALCGHLSGSGKLDTTAVRSRLTLSGNLNQPQLAARMDGSHIHLLAEAVIRPYAFLLNHKIVSINLRGQNINPAAFMNSLPKADLDFTVRMQPSATNREEINGLIDIRNHWARPYNNVTHTGLPLQSVNGRLRINANGRLLIPDLTARLLQQGQVTFSGNVDTAGRQLNMQAQLWRLRSRDVLNETLEGTLNGRIALSGTYSNAQTSWQLATEKGSSTGHVQILTDEQNGQQTLLLNQFLLSPAGGGRLSAKGSVALFKDRDMVLTIDSNHFNPGRLNPHWPAGNINGHIRLNGKLTASPQIAATMNWQNSVLSGAPLMGKAIVRYQDRHLTQADINLLLGRNRIITHGRFGRIGDRLSLDINAPNLDLFGFGLGGLLTAKGHIAGEPKKITADVAGMARNLHIARLLQIQNVDFRLQGSPDVSQPLNVRLDGHAIHIINPQNPKNPTRIDAVSVHINGRGSRHQIKASGNMSLAGKPYKLDIAAQGGLNPQYQWLGRVGTLNISGAFNLRLLAPLTLEAGSEKVAMNHARWAAMGGSLNVDSLTWVKGKGLATRGNARGLAVKELHNIAPLPIEQNLVLAGTWDFSYSNHMHGYLKVHQQAGDIILPARRQALGLSNVVLDTRFQNGRIVNHLTGNTRYGTADVQLTIAQNYGNSLLRAPIGGHIRLNVPDLTSLRHLMPVGMQVKGHATGDAVISGTLGNPQLSGKLNGDHLYYREQNSGVILENGSLRSRFQGRRWLIDALSFTRRNGDVTLKGMVNLTGITPDVDVTAHFSRYTILDQINRRLTLSGNARLLYTVNRGIILSGGLQVDQGHFGFQQAGMPELDDDVVVLGREKPPESAGMPISLNLSLDLNNRFRFSGEGLDVLLGGKLVVSANPRQATQVVGTVNIVRGQYKAYAQDLVIQRNSTISFVGPMDNPNLKLRAVRRHSPVGAGIEALGSLNNPRINLVASEGMSDKDKLSWLILGRGSSGSAGDEAALAAAASAWLAGGINNHLKLVDELGFSTQQTRNRQTGELNPARQVITVGKRLTNNLYLGYQYSIDSAVQTVRLTYQINRQLQTIFKAGSDSFGGEFRYTVRFD